MSTPDAGEIQKTPELHESTITGEQALDWLCFAGNDERKLITYLTVLHGGPQGKSELYHNVSKLAGVDKISGDLNTPFQFCESLSRVGAVKETVSQALRFGRVPITVPAFEASGDEAKDRFGRGFAGALGDWSLRHPELSLNILGNTASKHEARAPLVRFWMLYDLATTSDSPRSPSISFIARHIEVRRSTRINTIDRLRQLGLVKVDSTIEDNQRKFRIIHPEHLQGGRKRKTESLSTEAQMIYSTFKNAFEQKTEWGLDEFMDMVQASFPDASPELLKKARILMYQGFAPSSPWFKGEIEDITGPQYEGMTRVELTPEASQAIQELVSIVDGFYSSDAAIIEHGLSSADKIMSAPKSVEKLYRKGYENSNLANVDPHMDARLLKLVKAAGLVGLTGSQIRNLYAQESGRKVSTRLIFTRLAELQATNPIEAADHPNEQGRITRHYYSKSESA